LVDCVGDVASWGIDQLAYGVLLDSFDGRVGEDVVLGLNDHNGQFLEGVALDLYGYGLAED
jgi:hypothetical protein